MSKFIPNNRIKMSSDKLHVVSDNGNISFPRKPFIIGVSGGTASGKTSVCRRILDQLGQTSTINGPRKVGIISQENFYKALSAEELALANQSKFNFDHPDAFDSKLMKKTILDIAHGKTVDIPEYDFKTHTRKKDSCDELHHCDVVFIKGILVFYHKEIRDLFDMKLFVDTDADTRLSRRVLRDISERGRSLESVLRQYTMFVKPAFEEFCLPCKKYADVIIPRGSENAVAVNLIVQHIRDILNGGMLKQVNGGPVIGHVTNGTILNGDKDEHSSIAKDIGVRKTLSNGGRPH